MTTPSANDQRLLLAFELGMCVILDATGQKDPPLAAVVERVGRIARGEVTLIKSPEGTMADAEDVVDKEAALRDLRDTHNLRVARSRVMAARILPLMPRPQRSPG
ncbi:MAG: hypothetical protein JWM95_1052 [Gemmatimonadetes bacterium]|nr:hypothetical protein [Gemmatimonadota bacterium]